MEREWYERQISFSKAKMGMEFGLALSAGMEKGGEGRTRFLLALVILPLTTHPHPFRDGAPFLLLTETPPTLGRSLRLSLTLH